MLILACSFPIRAFLLSSGLTQNLFIENDLLYGAYDLVLSLLMASTGLGNLQRRPWASVVTAVTAGALIAVCGGSLAVLWGRYQRDSRPALEFCRAHWAFILVNATLLLAWCSALTLLLRLSEDRRRLLLIALLSFVACISVTGLIWVRLVIGLPIQMY